MVERTIRDIGPTPKFIPPHVNGDRDFHGNGPRVSLFSRLMIRNTNQLWVQVWMRARETKSDWTESTGSANYFLWHDPNVSQITRILSDTVSSHTYVDTDHADDEIFMGDADLVRSYFVTGDTRGDEAGIRTGVSVNFNPVTIDVVERSDRTVQTVQVSPSPDFVPSHVGGDRDFHGNGPRVTVTARINIRNTNEIWSTVTMDAIETKRDWTRARGSWTYPLYRHSRPIRTIVSDTFSSFSYVDTDHQIDDFALSPAELVERFEMVGDTRGNEAGSRTRVKVYYNPIDFIEG